MALPRLITLASLATFLASASAGCTDAQEHAQLDATMKTDGYALFVVENERQQRNDVSIVVKDAEPGATYALLYSPDTPTSAGWFLLDVNARSRCGGDLGPHCDIGNGFGYLVDFVKVPEGATEITLRDDRCGCGSGSKSWSGYWAVMRIERTDTEDQVTVHVWGKHEHQAQRPEITQLL